MPLARKPYKDMTLDDVRALIRQVKEEGLKIQSHYKKLELYYSDWEDDLKYVDDIIAKVCEDTGVEKEALETEDDDFSEFLEDDTLKESNNGETYGLLDEL